MADSSWFAAIDPIRRAFETGKNNTILTQQGRAVGLLPAALGGDPKQWRLLAAPAKSKEGFFTLLQEKAYFLTLPQTIAVTMRDSDRVSLSEEIPEDPRTLADTTQIKDPRGAKMRIPGASDGLASTGYEYGRSSDSAMARQYKLLSTIYHEMTHAWLWLNQFYDDEFQTLWINGVAAYTLAQDANGKHLDPDDAFTEAAASYVGDRILRWCWTIGRLDVLIRDKLTDPEEIQMKLQWIVGDYDEVVPTYGTVDHVRIASPDLSTTIRDALNKKVLDDCPCTKAFADTPLVGLRNWALPR